jgi:uncharacterized protein
MTPEMAREALDWYVDFVSPQLQRGRSRPLGLTFWGGEPMLNMRTIRAVLEYARTRYPGAFCAAMTTNGTLLGPENVEVLTEYDVNVAVSIDGPPEEHDSRRVTASGRGSLDVILGHLERIKRRHPDFWARNLSTIAVYDPHTDLAAVGRFFDERSDVIPRVARVNGMSSKDLAHSRVLTLDDVSAHLKAVNEVRHDFKMARIAGVRPNGYTETLINLELSGLLIRSRVHDAAIPFLPFSASCLPGYRLTVNPDGALDMCERVNSTVPIGTLDTGINGSRVRQLLSEYQEKVISRCHRCPVTRLCRVCLATVVTNGAIGDPEEDCRSSYRAAKQVIGYFLSIMEANPRAPLQTEWALEREPLHPYG